MPASTPDKPMSLTTRMRLIQLEVGQIERNNASLQGMLDVALAMYNSLMDWAVNTEHADAAAEIQQILESHMKAANAAAKKVAPDWRTASTRVGHL